MKDLKNKETKIVIGGGSISGAFVSAFKGYINVIKEIGQAFGSAIRRFRSGNLCKF